MISLNRNLSQFFKNKRKPQNHYKIRVSGHFIAKLHCIKLLLFNDEFTFYPFREVVAGRAKPQRLPLADDLQAVFVACTCNLRLQGSKLGSCYYRSGKVYHFWRFLASFVVALTVRSLTTLAKYYNLCPPYCKKALH